VSSVPFRSTGGIRAGDARTPSGLCSAPIRAGRGRGRGSGGGEGMGRMPRQI